MTTENDIDDLISRVNGLLAKGDVSDSESSPSNEYGRSSHAVVNVAHSKSADDLFHPSSPTKGDSIGEPDSAVEVPGKSETADAMFSGPQLSASTSSSTGPQPSETVGDDDESFSVWQSEPGADVPGLTDDARVVVKAVPAIRPASSTKSKHADSDRFRPVRPLTLRNSGLSPSDVERLVVKYLFQVGGATGRDVSARVCLPFQIIEEFLRQLKSEKMIAHRGAGHAGDYDYVMTDLGRERGRRYMEECAYSGSAPVPLKDYIDSASAQSIAGQKATETDLRKAFSDLLIDTTMLDRLGPAINSGRGMFLFGAPGNGKTSIAERVTGCFGSTIWIPKTLHIDGEIICLYDPMVHEAVEIDDDPDAWLNSNGVDDRWIEIVRPTVVAGGELKMDSLEVCQNLQSKICEAPLQLKSNCGTLVIDDFGRQTMSVEELLNRWIVPLEKRYDYLSMPSGRKVQVPFDQLIIFSTNLEPRDLVDGAFLRRIPYKIEAADPSEENFRKLCKIMAEKLGFEHDESLVSYLIETHYKPTKRPYRACQPRDILLQVQNYCSYREIPARLSEKALDFAVENYFAVM